MRNKKHIKSLPIKQLFWFLLIASFGIQSVIMSYRFLTGIQAIENSVKFWGIVIIGMLIGAFAGWMLALPDIHLSNRLNQHFRWGEKTATRICIQFIFTILIALVVSTAATLMSELIIGYKEPLKEAFVNNALIFTVVNIIFVVILEGWMLSRENRQNKRHAETLAHELLASRFEVLKNQINSHFMFNNLNVLSALIDSNQGKAQQFVEDFSDLYRYVLEMIEKPVVSVAKELEFIRSYITLHQIRHGETMIFEESLPDNMLDTLIPPFALQVAIENALKHNSMSIKRPLKIELLYANGFIEVRNNVQPLVSSKPSAGMGQINLTKRYELISDMLPVFEKKDEIYIAKLPLIIQD